MTTIANSSAATKAEITNITGPGFGQILVKSEGGNRAIFEFAADGSDETAGLTTFFAYADSELTAGRNIDIRAGIGKYGADGDGFELTVPSGSTLTFIGSGEQTQFGFVGSTPISSKFAFLKIDPTTPGTEDILGVAVAGDNVTVTLTLNSGHTATVGSRIRVYQAGQEPTEGEQLVTAITATDVTFVTDVATTVALGTAPRVSIFNNYLKNVEVGNMTFFDDDPAGHVSGGEETHGLFITSHLTPYIHDLWFRDIGDEGVELISCEGYRVFNIVGVGSPSVQTSGGGLVSIKNGCHNGVVDTVITREPFNPGSVDITYVLSIKTSGNSTTITGLTARNIIGNYPEFSTVNFGTAGADISGVCLYNVVAVGGGRAISQTGASFNLTEVDIYGLHATKQTIRTVDLARTKANAEGIRFHAPFCDGSHLTSSTRELFRLNGTNNRIYNGTLKNALTGVFTNNTEGLVVKDCLFDTIGGANLVDMLVNDMTDQDTVVTGTTAKNCQATNLMFQGCYSIHDSIELENIPTLTGGIASLNTHFHNNKKVSQRFRSGRPDGNLSYNEFLDTDPGVNGMILVSGDDCIVMGNTAKNQTANDGIKEDTGQDRNILTNNNMNGRPVTTVGGATIAANNL